MQDITAYVIVSVAHYLVVVVGFGLLCQSSYSSRTHATSPLCGYEFEVRECEKCE